MIFTYNQGTSQPINFFLASLEIPSEFLAVAIDTNWSGFKTLLACNEKAAPCKISSRTGRTEKGFYSRAPNCKADIAIARKLPIDFTGH